jgi:hypothetical protein
MRFSRGYILGDEINIDGVVTKVPKAKEFIKSLGFNLKKDVTLEPDFQKDLLDEVSKLAKKKITSIEDAKDELAKLPKNQNNMKLKLLLDYIKPQVKVGNHYYNDYLLTQIFDPKMRICEIIEVHGLDHLAKKATLPKTPEVQKLLDKKEVIKKSKETFGGNPGLLIKFNNINKKLLSMP